MVKMEDIIEFNNIVSDILKNDEFINLRYERHHGISRLEHCLSVAELAFSMCKKFNVKEIEEVTRAALLHDFFKDEEVSGCNFINHPLVALENSKRNFSLSPMQENIIASHMFPTSKVIPKYYQSLLVSLSDKLIAIKECIRYKVPIAVGTAFLFFLNIAIIQR